MVPMAPSSTRMRSRATRRSVCSAGLFRALVMGTDISAGSGLLPLPAGERGGVRGFGRLLTERVQNLFEYALRVSHDVVVPKPEHEISHRFQSSRPLFILRRALRMLAAIKLNDHLRISTNKVDDKPIDRNLSFEFPARESATAQTEPDSSLCIRLLPTQAPCCCRGIRHLRTNYVPNPLTPPLSPAGRGSRSCSWRCLGSTSPLGRRPSRWHTA